MQTMEAAITELVNRRVVDADSVQGLLDEITA